MRTKSATLRTSFAKIDQFCKSNSQLFKNQGKAPGRKYTCRDKDILKIFLAKLGLSF